MLVEVLIMSAFKVVPHDVIELDGDDDDPDDVMILGDSTSDYKNKQPVRHDKSWQKQVKVQKKLFISA